MRWAIVLVTLGAFAPSRAAAQQVDSTPRFGLALGWVHAVVQWVAVARRADGGGRMAEPHDAFD